MACRISSPVSTLFRLDPRIFDLYYHLWPWDPACWPSYLNCVSVPLDMHCRAQVMSLPVWGRMKSTQRTVNKGQITRQLNFNNMINLVRGRDAGDWIEHFGTILTEHLDRPKIVKISLFVKCILWSDIIFVFFYFHSLFNFQEMC